MPRLIPIGPRVLVTDLEPEVSIKKRAEAAGIYAVVSEENTPKPTSGKVEAVGSDPLTQELIAIGDIVLFARHAGIMVQIEGREYRSLELREVAHVIKPDPEPSFPPMQPEPVPSSQVESQVAVAPETSTDQGLTSSESQPPRE
jgi:co-chaperonin GroES (HSP10)